MTIPFVDKFAEKKVRALLAEAGIQVITGSASHSFDMRVHDRRLFREIFFHGSLGAGETYMKRWWDADDISELAYRLIIAGGEKEFKPLYEPLATLAGRAFNLQGFNRARQVIEKHYDLPPGLYDAMLDPYLQYTCAVWDEGVTTLAGAQELKLKRICRKLDLTASDTLLDIGCGWGGFAKWAAREHACKVVGVTLSGIQAKFAQKFCVGLPVEIRTCDYRAMPFPDGSFTKAASMGMVEHVGPKNYRTYLAAVHRLLKPGGRFLLHTISGDIPRSTSDPFMRKYIFPNSIAPTVDQLLRAAHGLFAWNNIENIGHHYHRTTVAWKENLLKAWPDLVSRGAAREDILRMFLFYLGIAGANFRARGNDVVQIEFTRL